MGITFSLLQELKEKGVIARAGLKVLDIGSSNLYQANAADVIGYVRSFDGSGGQDLELFANRMARGSAFDFVKGGLNEAFAGELLERCGMDYRSFDIAKGFRTEILDLNRDALPPKYAGMFDVVLNVGTTEHILNQYNCFKVIHDATSARGYMVHQLPVAGATDHGYFVYTGRMLFDMALTNNYDIVAARYEAASADDDLYKSVTSFAAHFPVLAGLQLPDQVAIPNFALTIVFRKNGRRPFRTSLDLSTSVGAIPMSVLLGYPTLALTRLKLMLRHSKILEHNPKLLGFLRWLSRKLRSTRGV